MSKQAVLLIHGIGEQRPMETLRSFAKTVWVTDTSIHSPHRNADAIWSKPYPLAQDFELRRLTTPENRERIRTDFFELYWAHLMQGTKIAHLVGWAKTLLLRRPSTVPPQLRLAYWVCIFLVVFGLFMAYRTAASQAAGRVAPFWISLTLTLFVIPAVMGILLNVVGDAARYLHVAPANVACRRAIRAMGVRVLKSLHRRGYDRIIVVGHSLGAVIAYDILYHTWAAFNEDEPTAQAPVYAALNEMERLAVSIVDGGDVDIAEFQAAQRDYFNEMKANGVRWRVSDLITLGSPLAHAQILMAHDAADFAAKRNDRELPCCPPTLETSQHEHAILRRFSYPPAAAERIPHHAAVFGPTRWTNLYFPSSAMIRGDLIGGPVRSVLGHGINDIAVQTRLWRGFLSHTHYWTPDSGQNMHVTALRQALDLVDERR
jgi:hypothetical protein